MTDPHQDLQAWIADWQQPDQRPVASDALVRYVRRRGSLLKAWVVGGIAIGVGGLVALTYLTVTRPDPIERWAMGTLALMCAAALGFSWWNWRGALRAVSETTTVYLDLAATRLVRIRRDLIAGWVLLSVEMAVLTPWVWYRVQSHPALEAGAPPLIWPWALLVTMGALGVVSLIAAGRWARREEAVVNQLLRECDDRA